MSAAIYQFKGQISTFKPYLGDDHPCYQCLVPHKPPNDTGFDCSQSGILGSVAGVMGSWQATEVIKELLGIGESLSGQLVVFDALESTSRKVRLRKDKACECYTVE